MAKARELVHRIPGGWYGNDPEPGEREGNVCVATTRIADALTWLRRRRATILATFPGQYGDADHGVVIRYSLR